MAKIETLFILYDYFYPGYKAGGPIQSLTNLAVALSGQYKIFVLTGSRDLETTETYAGVFIDKWNIINIPGSKNPIQIYYTGTALNRRTFKEILLEVKPSFIYFNNIYSYYFFRMPLQVIKNAEYNPKIIICPRGMLQQGALSVKPFKKKIYLTILRFTGLLNKSFWHATNQEESDDIKKYFPKNKGVAVAPNIPKPPFADISYPEKKKGYLNLIFLSLIANKKNLLLLLQVMQLSGKNIFLDIYGPVVDKQYWQQCESLIKQMPDKVQYKGEVQPAQVQQVLSQYHALILLTKGENFGHAIYESLSVGRPVITSYFTPWNNLYEERAGANTDILNKQDCLEKLDQFADMNGDEYNLYCRGAHECATQYYQNLDAEMKYKVLFRQYSEVKSDTR